MPVAAKMQYIASGMMKLVSYMFHDKDWNIQFDTWLYFYELYILQFYPAWEDYIDENKDFEKPYPYKFKPMTKNKLEEDLKDCLTKLIELYPEKNWQRQNIHYLSGGKIVWDWRNIIWPIL